MRPLITGFAFDERPKFISVFHQDDGTSGDAATAAGEAAGYGMGSGIGGYGSAGEATGFGQSTSYGGQAASDAAFGGGGGQTSVAYGSPSAAAAYGMGNTTGGYGVSTGGYGGGFGGRGGVSTAGATSAATGGGGGTASGGSGSYGANTGRYGSPSAYGPVAYGPGVSPVTGAVANFGSGLGFGLGKFGEGDPAASASNTAIALRAIEYGVQHGLSPGQAVSDVMHALAVGNTGPGGTPTSGSFGYGNYGVGNVGTPGMSVGTFGYPSMYGPGAGGFGGSPASPGPPGYARGVPGYAVNDGASVGGVAPVSGFANAPSAYASNMMGVGTPNAPPSFQQQMTQNIMGQTSQAPGSRYGGGFGTGGASPVMSGYGGQTGGNVGTVMSRYGMHV